MALAREVFGEATHRKVAISAVSVRSRRRHILDGGRYPLADLVAASSAVPGLLPPRGHRPRGLSPGPSAPAAHPEGRGERA